MSQGTGPMPEERYVNPVSDPSLTVTLCTSSFSQSICSLFFYLINSHRGLSPVFPCEYFLLLRRPANPCSTSVRIRKRRPSYRQKRESGGGSANPALPHQGCQAYPWAGAGCCFIQDCSVLGEREAPALAGRIPARVSGRRVAQRALPDWRVLVGSRETPVFCTPSLPGPERVCLL